MRIALIAISLWPLLTSFAAGKTIVILGSSTAVGSGATPLANGWATLYGGYLTNRDAQNRVINLAVGGYTTSHILPTGTVDPDTNHYAVDPAHNITAALTHNPDAVLINLGSNDTTAYHNFAGFMDYIKTNYLVISAACAAANVPIWWTTTQPRNTDDRVVINQMDLRDWINATYGAHAIDFWTTIATYTNQADINIATTYTDTINPIYNVDGVHVNNAGHLIFFQRVTNSGLYESLFPATNSFPSIVSPPTNQSVLLGNSVTFSVLASGPAPLAYQWRKAENNLSGDTNAEYTIASTMSEDAGNYDVVISNPSGSVTSVVAVLTVALPPVIVTNPVSQILATGEPVTFTTTAIGSALLNYQWSYQGVNLFGATNATLTLSSVATNDAGDYYVVVSNDFGAQTSQVANLFVYLPVHFVTQPQSQVAALFGTATFTSSVAAFPPPSYQWQFNGSAIPDANLSSLLLTNIGPELLGAYAVVAANAYSVTTSSVALLQMRPQITGPVAGATVLWGQSVNLAVTALGSGPLSYQWFKDGVALKNGTNALLAFPNVQLADGGLYSVVVTGPLGGSTNPPALLEVNPANIAIGLFAGVIITGTPGYTYGIQSSTNLGATATWTTITNLTLTKPREIWVDPQSEVPAPGVARRFYRVVVP